MYGPHTHSAGRFITVRVSDIEPNPAQPRQEFDALALANLATSIRQHGILQPIVLRIAPTAPAGLSPSTATYVEAGDGSVTPSIAESGHGSLAHRDAETHRDDFNVGTRYHLVAGERRWRAAQLAGLREIPAILIEATTPQLLELALVENLQRADLSPLEEAHAYEQMIRHLRMTQEEVALRVGRSRAAIANRLRLLNLSKATRSALNNQLISEGHARALLALSGPDQDAALSTVLQQHLSVRQTERLVRQHVRAERSSGPADAAHGGMRMDTLATIGTSQGTSQETRRLEDAFRRALGTKVELSRHGPAGKLIIEFFSDEELERLFAMIVGAGVDDRDE